MNDADMNARLKELYLPPAKDFVLVDVPEMRYIMIDGHGARNRSEIEHARQWLFAVIHPIRRIAKARMGKNFVEPPLEYLSTVDPGRGGDRHRTAARDTVRRCAARRTPRCVRR